MSDKRLHLRFSQELLPWASVNALRRIILLPDNVATVGDVIRAIAARFQPQGAFELALNGSRFHEADPAAVIRDEDVLHLVRVATLPSPRAARAACECGAGASCQFSTRQWGFLCKGRRARCKQCASGLQAIRQSNNPTRTHTQDLSTHSSGSSDTVDSHGGIADVDPRHRGQMTWMQCISDNPPPSSTSEASVRGLHRVQPSTAQGQEAAVPRTRKIRRGHNAGRGGNKGWASVSPHREFQVGVGYERKGTSQQPLQFLTHQQ